MPLEIQCLSSLIIGTFANFVGALGGKGKSRLGPCRDRSDALSLKLVSNGGTLNRNHHVAKVFPRLAWARMGSNRTPQTELHPRKDTTDPPKGRQCPPRIELWIPNAEQQRVRTRYTQRLKTGGSKPHNRIENAIPTPRQCKQCTSPHAAEPHKRDVGATEVVLQPDKIL